MGALDYHEATKHHFNRFARSSGRLDWATQPEPFRRYDGAAFDELPRTAAVRSLNVVGGAGARRAIDEADIASVDAAAVGDLLRCALGLSAWKQVHATRWALRVNPSSGNLHPTEAYVIDGRVSHYAPREHGLEVRTHLDATAWQAWTGGGPGVLVALTSIIWREGWKYGERAFRYCQHDVGHAIAALTYAAALRGWQVRLLPWSDAAIAALTGIDRDADYRDAEREEPECMMAITPGDPQPWVARDPAALVAAARGAVWTGVATQPNIRHVEWPLLHEIAAATRVDDAAATVLRQLAPVAHPPTAVWPGLAASGQSPRDVILTRRSAVAFDAHSALPRATFLRMLAQLDPAHGPWPVLGRPALVHLAFFVHRVTGLTPGLYACLRDPAILDAWRVAMRDDFLWEPVDGSDGRLWLLLPMDMTWPATRVSCDQDIAGHGFFSLGMLAPLGPSLRQHGDWFYRRLFWECGVIGQVLYLEAEAAGARATGIGCFFDDAVHELLGLKGDAWQSLYHFSMGVPIEDTRLSTSPGYEWEGGQRS